MSKRLTTVLTVLVATLVMGVGPATVSSSSTPSGGTSTATDLAGGRWGCC